MFSQASVCHSVHNRPHGYSVTAHPPTAWLVCVLLECFLVGHNCAIKRFTKQGNNKVLHNEKHEKNLEN